MGTPLGRGGASTFLRDLANTDCMLVMGSNFAECHPVGFRFVMLAREKGAEIIHVDPRFSRTSACATRYMQIRAGSDIAFLGALIHQVLESERWRSDPFFEEYVRHYTNAATIIEKEFRDVADLGGLFSGWRQDHYCPDTWQYAGMQRVLYLSEQQEEICKLKTTQSWGMHAGRTVGGPPERDETMQHPRCVLQLLRRHFSAYTPEAASRICGVPAQEITAVGDALLRNSGRNRTSAIAYAVGWTQHTTGPQIIASSAILQLLLGNIGRPGGGIQALRGHATIQGSTDIPTLYDLLPGYLHMPTHLGIDQDLGSYIWNEGGATGVWANTKSYLVSLLKAWYGDAATAENEFGYAWLPRIDRDYSHMPMFIDMHEGCMEGLVLMGQNPAVGGPNARYQREAMHRLKWLVVRDIFMTESATFWEHAPEVRSGEVRPEEIGTEVFVLPAATVPEKDGSFTNTHRLIQWHHKAVEAPGDARSDAWFIFHLGRRLKERHAHSAEPRDAGLRALTWDYPTEGAHAEPSIEHILREVNGYRWASDWNDREQLASGLHLADDGSTACGCWIYTGVFTDRNRAASREPDDYVAPGWGFAWPSNVRLLYNRCSADPEGRPWSPEKKYVWWDERERRWTGADVPDFPRRKPPEYVGDRAKGGLAAISGDSPFVMKPDGKAWLFFPNGMKDGPMPTHYEPWESPVENALYREYERNPETRHWDMPGNRYSGIANPEFPHVLTTYRLTEHHTGGGMTRWNSWLSELQPEAFVELSPELARELGVRSRDWVTVVTARGRAPARALVTRRLRPLEVQGRVIHQVGFPWHFGYEGLVRGASANDLVSLVGEPNVTIHEGKVMTCNLVAGRDGDAEGGNGGRGGKAGGRDGDREGRR
ncbi:MAG TPA: molybdopterin-dependent oxidoreductase [Gemmatimonadales bacterium]|nr:molybdopterin-dependent oxidoreductase [Gemmatimonadales bacterium]